MSDSVFEIREYLDGNGKVSGHDVLDISKELEFMAKMCGDMEQSAQGDINDDERFIRELAEIADSKENDLHAGADDGGVAGSDEAFWSALDESESTNNTSSTTSTHPASQTKSTTAVNHQKKAASASSSGGGWKKGFFSNNKTTTKAAATSASTDTKKSIAVDNVTIGTASMTVDDSAPSSTTVKSNSDIHRTNPNSGSNVSSSPAATATSTVTFAEPELNTQQPLPEPPQPPAFSGSILERVPAPVAPLGAGGKLGRLGSVKKVN